MGDFQTLGIDPATTDVAYKLELDEEGSRKWFTCLGTCICGMALPVAGCLSYPCWIIPAKKWAASRKAALTEDGVVYKSGYNQLLCCAWSETVKTVPLSQITDMQLKEAGTSSALVLARSLLTQLD